jgi:formylglycine-generating enzyme required for sulfatase activity
VQATGGNAGSGCTGNYEELATGGKGLCVTKLVSVIPAEADDTYEIDATEVTRGQYDAWLATKPDLPARIDTNCGYKASGSYAETGDGFTGPDADHHPVVYVDWCDAYAYCAGVGKRLCGDIFGGSMDYDNFTDPTRDEWSRACTSGGMYAYPYGDTTRDAVCNDGTIPNASGTTVVGSLPGCESPAAGYTGVYDLAGNVVEWEDSCSGTQCRIRGSAYGTYLSDTNDSHCAGSAASYANYAGRTQAAPTLGFRCCSL